MKIQKILISITFLVATIFMIICWAVPFDDINKMPENIVVNSQNNDPNLGGLVNTVYNEDSNTVDFMLLNTIKLRTVNAIETKQVYIGGDTLGFEYQGDGVLVVSNKGLGVENTELEVGDIIKSVNNIEVNSIRDLRQVLDDKDSVKSGVLLKIVRNDAVIEKVIKPSFDALTQKYKLGIWAKDGLNGVGTLTYIDPTSGRYGALGHPIVEPSTRIILDVESGTVQKCVVLGVKKAGRGSPGEIKAVLSRGDSAVGSVDKNCESGIFGTLNLEKIDTSNRTLVDLGGRLSAHPGKAFIYSAIDGKNIRPYEIEIIKTNYQGSGSQKNLVFRVTDKRLLSSTGGIVQGMSGSPIVQDSKLIGAVTHVFVNDPTKGFGIYIDNMINN